MVKWKEGGEGEQVEQGEAGGGLWEGRRWEVRVDLGDENLAGGGGVGGGRGGVGGGGGGAGVGIGGVGVGTSFQLGGLGGEAVRRGGGVRCGGTWRERREVAQVAQVAR